MEEREELSLEEAAALLGLPAGDLLDLLREAGLRVGSGAPVRLQASEVLALQGERDRRRTKNLEDLSRLSEEFGEEEDP